MIGLFQELGPCGVDADGNPYNNPYSWSNASNMVRDWQIRLAASKTTRPGWCNLLTTRQLFIDQPTTVGLSYSIPVPGYKDNGAIIQLPNNTCPDYAEGTGTCGTYSKADIGLVPNSTQGAAPNMWKTLQGFMGAFPQYSRNGFSFTTESYGGHYGPVFNGKTIASPEQERSSLFLSIHWRARRMLTMTKISSTEYFLQQNAKKIPGAIKIQLENVLIGNGWFDPLIQYQAYYNYSVFPGNTYDYDPYNASIKEKWYNNLYGKGNCVDQTKECYATGRNDICANADNFCAYNVELMFDTYSGRDEYDMRELSPDPFPYEYYVDYLNSPKVQAAIGAYQNFSESSSTVSNAFSNTGDDDRESNTIEDVRKLLKAGVQVVMYFGDA